MPDSTPAAAEEPPAEEPPAEERPADERDALLSIAHGAVVTSGGVTVQRGLSIGIEAILTRGLGPETYGVYAFGWRLTGMVLRFANLGADLTLLRDVPAFAAEPARRRRSVGLSYATTAVTATAIAVGLGLSAEQISAWTLGHPLLPPVLRLFAVTLVALAFVQQHAALLKAAKSANGEVLLSRVLRPGVRLVGAGLATAVGYGLVGIVGAIGVTTGVLAVAAYPVAVRTTDLRPAFRGLRSDAAHFFDHAVPSALSRVGGLLRTRVDVLLIGVLMTSTAAGVYNVALVLVAVAAIPLRAFNQLLPPVAAELYSTGATETLDRVYTTVTRLVVTLTLPVVAVLAVFGPDLLGAFGPEFRRGYPVLLVFLVGRFVGNAVGATGLLLSMTDNHYPKMVLDWLLAALNVVLTAAFVVEFGLVGAALGTSLAIAVQNLLQATLLARFEGLWPFDRSFLAPLGAAVGMTAVMVGVRAVLPGLLAVGVGTLGGVLAFAALLGALGWSPRDRFVVRALRDAYRGDTPAETSDRGSR